MSQNTSAPAKVALSTEGSRGLGKDTALNMARKGINVIITFHTKKDEADKVVHQIEQLGRKAIALQLDASNTKSFPAFVAQVKVALTTNLQRQSFDFLINNAGTGLHANFTDTTEDQFDALMNIHFKGVFFLTQALLPLIADGGRIVNVSSGLARFTIPGASAYATMKGAVEVLTRYLAKELGHRGIAVNTVAPGAIETDFNGGVVRDNPQLNGFLATQTALGRVGVPEDIGAMIASLVLEDNRWINGQRIEASGGMFL